MIGYHVVIDVDGEVHKGRPLNVTGAHVRGHNRENIGICLIGTDKFSWAQFDALQYHLHALTQIYDIYPEDFYCHNQFTKLKTCPGFRINQFLSWYCNGRREALGGHVLQSHELVY